MATNLWILNGPNLNLLGEREPEIYGSTTLEAIEFGCRDLAKILDVELEFRQTNHEGVLVDWIQESRKLADAMIINPAGYSFNSIPVLDALKTLRLPVLELHISNIHGRDALHCHSVMSSVVTAVICGVGPYGYILAMQAAAHILGKMPLTLPKPIRATDLSPGTDTI